MEKNIIHGFSKLSKEEKLKFVAEQMADPHAYTQEIKSFWHPDRQELFDDISENTISNYYLPYSVAPNFIINGRTYHVPMVTEESSVVAAASNNAKLWSRRGGYHTRVLSTRKIGQVHFIWEGTIQRLNAQLPKVIPLFKERTRHITRNMEKRGGGIIGYEFVDMTRHIPYYYQLKVTFETVDSMGANFMNSCLEECGMVMRDFFCGCAGFEKHERNCSIIMSILSNYAPDCLVESYVETDIRHFENIHRNLSAKEFVWRFEKAVQMADADPYRATTHNKGIYNGIDAVAMATGNDFRAIESSGHAYAAKDGRYRSLTRLECEGNTFRYILTVPLAMGTVGGLTKLHPLARRSLELLGNPNAQELMQIAAAVGLANNFAAVRSLVTEGIQFGHMKMHLMNVLNFHNATDVEKEHAVTHFKSHRISYNTVTEFIEQLRTKTA